MAEYKFARTFARNATIYLLGVSPCYVVVPEFSALA